MLMVMLAVVAIPVGAQEKPQPVEATTAGGDKVMLHPNGRWEYVNAAKAAEAQKYREADPAVTARPAEGQGGWFGFGRTILPGDKDYNRGSLNPNRR
jgi:hypothetical protein